MKKSKEELLKILENQIFSDTGQHPHRYGGIQDVIDGYKTMAEGYKIMMGTKDFLAAMLFFDSGIRNIIIQVPNTDCIPLVKRMIISHKGTPSFIIGRLVAYGNQHIKVISITNEQDFYGYLSENLFYVGYADESELQEYEWADESRYTTF